MYPVTNFDFSMVVSVVAGIASFAAVIKSGHVAGLKTQIDSLRLQVQELATKVIVLQTERDLARAELGLHSNARIEIADVNRDLYSKLVLAHETIISLQTRLKELRELSVLRDSRREE